MYYPVLRGKQFELIALRELAKLQISNFFRPVIEPVKKLSKPFTRTIKELNDANIVPIVIINSTLGEDDSYRSFYNNLKKEGVDFLPCIAYDNNDTYTSFQEIVTYLGEATHCFYIKSIAEEKVFNHTNNAEMILLESTITIAQKVSKAFKLPVVVIEDGFAKQIKNADYPSRSDFSSAIGEYKDAGLSGFGDYTITGSSFSEGGGPAYVVALHLSQIIKVSGFLSPDFSVIINHFCSKNNGSYADPAGKFFEALGKLHKFIDNHSEEEIPRTKSVVEFIKLYESKHFPGLGAVKKLAILHHVEIIAKHISGI